MPKYKITYYREYEVEDNEIHAVGIADQKFTDDIRETLLELGRSRIVDLFNFKTEKMKKNGVLKEKIAEK